MNFTGTVYFDFDSYDVWRIYTVMLKASQDRSVTVDVEWRAYTTEDPGSDSGEIRALRACEGVRTAHPAQHEKFVRAMLTLVYQERDKPGAEDTLAVAAHVAGLDGAVVVEHAREAGKGFLETAIAEALEKGVSGVPTIERQGPPVLIKTNSAINYGSAVSRLRLIDHMIRDDGIWEMTKPST